MSTSSDSLIEAVQSMVDIANSKESHKMKFVSSTSDFTISYANPIRLNPKRQYVFALKRFAVYNSLANIDADNNRLTMSSDNGKTWFEVVVAPGAYEIKALNTRLQALLKTKGHDDVLSIEADENTSRAILTLKKTGYQVDFTRANSLRGLLGFKSGVYKAPTNVSDDIIKITLTNDIDIHCNLIGGNSYVNGDLKPVLYSISAYSVQVGAKVIVSEINPVFLPVNKRVIDSIRFQILDDNQRLLNFSGETIILDCILTQV